MKILLIAVLTLCVSLPIQAAEIFSHPPDPSGGLIASAWVSPDGSNSDIYSYDDFTLPTAKRITEVRWRGGYTKNAIHGRVTDFTITFFESNVTGFEPNVTLPESKEIFLAKYRVGGNAGEEHAGTVGNIGMYDYKYVLPQPVPAEGGKKYWVRIQAFQAVYPDWGIAVGAGGDGSHFQYNTSRKRFKTRP
jgi:hypothetical protein